MLNHHSNYGGLLEERQHRYINDNTAKKAERNNKKEIGERRDISRRKFREERIKGERPQPNPTNQKVGGEREIQQQHIFLFFFSFPFVVDAQTLETR